MAMGATLTLVEDNPAAVKPYGVAAISPSALAPMSNEATRTASVSFAPLTFTDHHP